MNTKNKAGATAGQAAALPEATKTTAKTVLHSDVFKWYEGDGVAFLCEKTTARVYAATDAIQTLTALLLQREIDAEAQADGEEPRLTMDTRTTVGLLHALATCNASIQQMTVGGTSYGAQVRNGEEATSLTRAAQKAVWQQDVKRAALVNKYAGGEV